MQTLLNLTHEQHLFDYGFRDYAYGMLPLADKPIAAYHLDRLAQQSVSKVYVIVTNTTEQSAQGLGQGEFWSLDIEYINVDSLRGLQHYMQLQGQGIAEINLSHGLSKRSGTQEYTLNEFIADNIQVLTQADFQLPSYQVRPNMFMSEGAKSRAMPDFAVHLGQYAQLKTRCIFRGPAIIGAGSIIDHGNILDNTVVMPNTYVGSDLDLSNCLVTPGWIYHQITKECIHINENRMLAAA